MIILGINQDRYDSGVTLVEGSDILFAANEERFTRKKTQGGFPHQSLAAAFAQTSVRMQQVEAVCVAGLMTPPLAVRMFPFLYRFFFSGEHQPGKPPGLRERFVDFVQNRTPLAHTGTDSLLRRMSIKMVPGAVRRSLPEPLRKCPIHLVEHHTAHAASAWHISGLDEALCVTGDGMGDGLSMSISRCADNRIERLWSATSRDSPGLLYEMVTEAAGFIPCRHEGKIMGLAAHGTAANVSEPDPFTLRDGRLLYHGPVGCRGVDWMRKLIDQHSREDVAAWVQDILERHVTAVTEEWLRTTGLTSVVVAGGIFANVKLNQRLCELPEVEQLFVCPNMGDGGLSLGAICQQFDVHTPPIRHVFTGDAVASADIPGILQAERLSFEHCPNIEQRVAERLAEGFLVARCRGRMEWGPRALGNRSILADTTQAGVVARLNELLRRNDFMPFAPAVLDECADQYFCGLDQARHAAQFMTVCFNATEQMKSEHPAVTHVDGTVRPQLVTERNNASFYRLLDEFRKLTGRGVLLNTSFNIHEEPIVRTAEHAVRSFLVAGLDYLAIEDYLVAGRHLDHGRESHQQISPEAQEP